MSVPTRKLCLFGGLKIVAEGEVVEKFPTKRSALILARLALSRQRQASRDELAECLWPDDYLDATRMRLRQELRRIREALGNHADVLEADRLWVRLREDLIDSDIWAFDRQFVHARGATAPPDRARFAQSALSEITGPLVPESSEPWILGERESYLRRRLEAYAILSQAHLDLGDLKAALVAAEEGASMDPLNEEIHAALIRAHLAQGATIQAKRTFLDFESRLTRRLGTEPTAALRQLLDSTMPRGTVSLVPTIEVKVPRRERIAPPSPETTFGRAQEISTLKSWMAASGGLLVSITGPGGVGKTHLVQEVFADHGGATYVELAPQSESSVLEAVRSAMGLTSNPTRHDCEDVADSLKIEPTVLILDNAEHVHERVRSLVDQVRQLVPDAQIMVTSRQRLELDGEREFPVAPLELPPLDTDPAVFDASPSVALFMDRARRVRPNLKLDEESRQYLALLIKRLEGLPLAVQIAADQVDVLSLRQILIGLDDTFTNLVHRDPRAGRHSSLRSAFEWSFRLLGPEQQKALQIFAHFPGGWSLEMAKMAIGEQNAVFTLRNLLSSSLIYARDHAGDTRYSMLETIRAFAQDSVGPDEEAEIAGRAVRIIADQIFADSRKQSGPNADIWFDAVGREMSTAVAAFTWAKKNDMALAVRLGTGLWRYFCAKGDTGLGVRLFTEGFEPSDIEDFAVLGEFYLGLATMHRIVGQREEAGACFDKALAAYQRGGKERSYAWVAHNYAYHLLDVHEFEQVIKRSDESLEILYRVVPAERWPEVTILARAAKAMALVALGKSEEGVAMMEQAFADRLVSNEPGEVAKAYFELASTYWEVGRTETVLPLARTSIRYLREAGIQDFLVSGLQTLATMTNDDDERMAVTIEGEAIARRSGDRSNLMRFLAHKSLASAEGRRHLAEAFSLATQPIDVVAILDVMRQSARFLAKFGFEGQAKVTLQVLDRLRQTAGVSPWPAEVRVEGEVMGLVHAAEVDLEWHLLLKAAPLGSACALFGSLLSAENQK